MTLAGTRGTYTAYHATTSLPGNPPDQSGPYIGYRSSYTSTARYNAHGGGAMIDATDRVAFDKEENGGPLDIQTHYVVIEAENGMAYAVLDVREVPGLLIVTLAAQAPPTWHSPVVIA